MRFDQIRSVLRGEVNGSMRFLLLFFGAAVVWVVSNYFSNMAASASSVLRLQRERYNALAILAAEYKAAAPAESASQRLTNAMTAFTQVSSQIDLGVRVGRISPSPDGRRCSVEVGRLYAEELAELVRGLAERGMRVSSARIRALPAGQERLFSLEADIETD